MSGPPSAPNVPKPGDASGLASLRAELDRLDDTLHDTLMRRAEVVRQVGALGVKGAVPLRPGREAAIIRRLLARHAGALPAFGIVRIWRELLAATTAEQHPLLIAVCQAADGSDYLAVAREQFGAQTPLRAYATAGEAIAAVQAGAATVAVLPAPAQDEAPNAAWWVPMLRRNGARLHVVARLPFWTPRPEGAPSAQALVVSVAAPDPSGQDRSMLGLEPAPGESRAGLDAALAAAGFTGETVVLRHDPGSPAAHALAEIEGLVGDDDPRLSALSGLLRPPVVLGAYAVPLMEKG